MAFVEMKDVYKQIGNAVPISLGFAIGQQVVKLVSSQELDLPPVNFPFSRYTYTDDISIRKLMQKRLHKNETQPELEFA